MLKHQRIQQLPASVANQIAAGEVIERPASVVKELLENALDAGADIIHIDIGFGGLNQIKISDNGSGILAEDLPLAIAAHATSKIRQLNDLYALSSMGFRGEALASIAAISKLSISSKPDAQEHAMMLRVEGSASPDLFPCARSRGTTIDVVDLFFNAPVRKKFLKSAKSEYQAIEVVVKRFALSEPAIALILRHNGKDVFTLPAATCEKTRELRIRKLLGKGFMDEAHYLDIEQAGMRLYGWVSGLSYQRSQNDKQWVYVNQRMMKDKLIHHAIKQAYDDLLHPGRYPACLLYLTMPGEQVDVNVHPTKHEVRFQQPRLVHDFISSHIAGVLKQSKQETIAKVTMVREEYTKQPIPAERTISNKWMILNEQFAIISFTRHCEEHSNEAIQKISIGHAELFRHYASCNNTVPYLVDIAKAHHHWLLSILNQQSFPLVSRPLLVPVRYTLTKNDHRFIDHYQPMLSQLGLTIDWTSTTEIVVRTIPMLFPQLNIKQLLQQLSTRFPTQAELAELVASCQSFDAYQLTEDDKILLADYLEQQLTSPAIRPWCMRLDSEKCRELFGVAAHV